MKPFALVSTVAPLIAVVFSVLPDGAVPDPALGGALAELPGPTTGFRTPRPSGPRLPRWPAPASQSTVDAFPYRGLPAGGPLARPAGRGPAVTCSVLSFTVLLSWSD